MEGACSVEKCSPVLFSESSRAFPKIWMWRWVWGKWRHFYLPYTLRRCRCRSEMRRLKQDGSGVKAWGRESLGGEMPSAVLWTSRRANIVSTSWPHLICCHTWSPWQCSLCIWDSIAVCVCTQAEHKDIHSGTLVWETWILMDQQQQERREEYRREKWSISIRKFWCKTGRRSTRTNGEQI